MENMKCSTSDHECPEGLDTCCQFCSLNYSPCAEKCSGCWDEITTDRNYKVDNLAALTWDRTELDQLPSIV